MRRGWLAIVPAAAFLVMACSSAEDAKQRWVGADEAGDSGPAPGPRANPDHSPARPTQNAGDSGAANAPDPNEPDAGPGPMSCASNNACNSARDLGAVSGDSRTDMLTTEGSTSTWLKLRVTEDAGGVLAYGMKVTLTLVSPAGANFDLFAYGNADADTLECSKTMGSSTQPEKSDTVSLAWGESWTANNSIDSRTIMIEVRHVGGTCAANQKWTLLVQGNK